MDQRIGGWIARSQPDVILLLGGTNDIRGGTTPQLVVGTMSGILRRIHRDAPQANVFVGTIPPQPNNRMPAVSEYNAGIMRLKLPANCRIVDFYWRTSDISRDHVHPTTQGYYKMAQVWYQAIKTEGQNRDEDDNSVHKAME